MVHAAAQAQAALEKRSARPCAANATKALQGGQVGACKGRAVSSKHKARAHREGQATISPHAGDGEGGERALTTHLPCRGLAELVRRRGVAAPAERERVGSVTRQTAEQSGCAGYGRTSGKIGIVHAAPRAGEGGLTGLRPNSHCAGFVTNSKIPSGNLNPGFVRIRTKSFFSSAFAYVKQFLSVFCSVT